MSEASELLGAVKVDSCMCAFGMRAEDNTGEGLVLGETTFMTNSLCIAARLERVCSNNVGGRKHRHVHLINQRAKKKEVYPPLLVREILLGLIE